MKIYLIFFFLIFFEKIFCQNDTFCDPKTLTGEDCSIECYENCLNRECYKNEKCISCKSGYVGDQCDEKCPENCNECEEVILEIICSSCKEGFYGKKCESECSNCPEGKCDSEGICSDKETKCIDDSFFGDSCNNPCSNINSNCVTCNRKGEECLTCKESFYGKKCELECSNCPEGKCDSEGICLDKETKCIDDSLFGESCNKSCSIINSNCLTCNRKGEECSTCQENFYGKKCEFNCTNCPDGKCDSEGICLDKETKCIDDSFFGDSCNDTCSSINSNCVTCNRKGEECLTCKESFYGKKCESECSNCPNKKCSHEGICEDKETKCINDSFYGDSCNEPCSNINCLTCKRDKTCSTCNKSKFGDHCENSCENCFNEECDMSGKCSETKKCKENFYYNEFCNGNCQKNCSSDGCDKNGKCIKECSKNHYKLNSEFCDKECEKNCEKGSCDDDTGVCKNCEDKTLFGNFCNETAENIPEFKNCYQFNQKGDKCISCKNNIYYGDKCENDCSFGCSRKFQGTNYSICEIDGRCEGCLKNYFGPFCNEKCEGCGESGCDDQGYCKEFKCIEGKYGLKCDQNCNCESNSNSLECGKFSGECLNCKFGYFGNDCTKQCNYKCKNGLCCIFKEENKNSELNFETNYKYVDITINNKKYKIEIDYNYGYPLTLFNDSSTACTNIKNDTIFENIEGTRKSITVINFTNYQIKGDLFEGSSYIINKKTLSNIDVIVADEINCEKTFDGTENVNGVIGLGFFNSISNSLFGNNTKEQNILSYSINKKNKEQIEFQFGSMTKDEINYIDKLTFCEVIFKDDTDIQGKAMTCQLNGIKSAKHSSGLRLNNASITFSLGQSSSLILNNDQNYRKYLENEYFNEKAIVKQDNVTKNYYYLYPKDKINKLFNFGFVFNDFFYSYDPNLFFKKELEDGKKRFLIEFSNEHSEFVLGKEFLEDIIFTINNEEAKIYFYARNAEYSDKLKDKTDSGGFKIQLETREIAAICLSILIFLNLVAFAIYYFLKRKKMNSSDYINLD